MPTIALTYFDAPGRAEPIRMSLRLGNLPFEDRRLKFPEFVAAKGELPLGQVPVLEVDGLRITQTGAILRYVARIGDETLYPSDPMAALLVDSALDSFNDTLSHAMMPSLFERDMEKKLAMRVDLAAGPMKRVLDYVDGLVARSGGPFVAGRGMSIADLVIAAQVDQIRRGGLDGITTAYLEAWPRLVALAEAVNADPRLAS